MQHVAQAMLEGRGIVDVPLAGKEDESRRYYFGTKDEGGRKPTKTVIDEVEVRVLATKGFRSRGKGEA